MNVDEIIKNFGSFLAHNPIFTLVCVAIILGYLWAKKG